LTVVAIHQPQYLPWVPYFDKADQADVFVYLDNVSYQKNGVQNRNQIKSSSGAIWLTVPVRAGLGTPIREVRIAGAEWRKKHLRSIAENYARAAYVERFHAGLKPILERDWDRLADLDIEVIEWMLGELGVTCRRVRASELEAAGTGEELVIAICKQLGATEYLSGRGAAEYQNPRRFEECGIRLRYQSCRAVEYAQCHANVGFLPDLSALDLILNCGPQSCATMRACRSNDRLLAQ
jgi:hypothetical protein